MTRKKLPETIPETECAKCDKKGWVGGQTQRGPVLDRLFVVYTEKGIKHLCRKCIDREG